MTTKNAVAQISLEAGASVTFAGDPHPWTVKAVTDNFAALTRPISRYDRDQAEWLADPDDKHWENPYEDDGTLYTVIDWRNGVRGPCNLVGQSYGDGEYTEAECAQMLAEFEGGDLEVSHRNRVRIEFGEVTA